MPYLNAIYSRTAYINHIDNIPNEEQYENMIYTAKYLYEPVHEAFMGLILVTSFFRSDKLNKIIKGAKHSQHVKGQAIDFTAMKNPKFTNKNIFEFIRDYIDFDQLIWEKDDGKGNPKWVHASITNNKNRNQIIYNK